MKSNFRGGGQYGQNAFSCINATWPFATLSIVDNALNLRIGGWKQEFKKSEIASIEKYRGLFSKGIRIRHLKDIGHKHVIFWTFEQDTLLECLQKKGFETAGSSKPLSAAD